MSGERPPLTTAHANLVILDANPGYSNLIIMDANLVCMRFWMPTWSLFQPDHSGCQPWL